MVEAMYAEPTNLDMFKATRRPERTILDLIYEPLFVFNEDLGIEPLLVESWSLSEDQLTWTFNLKEGITFHDGTSFDAEAAKIALEAYREKGTYAWMLHPLAEVRVVGKYTFVITLDERYPLLLSYLARYPIGMIAPSAIENPGATVLGTGPFKFKKWISGDRIILERNEDYKHGPSFVANKGPAYVDEWIFRFILEPSILLGELTDGDVDISDYITAKDVSTVRDHPAADVIVSESTTLICDAINCSPQNEPYNDVKIRQAIAHATNEEVVRKVALYDVAAPCHTILATTVQGYWEQSEAIAYTNTAYDVEKAEMLLEEAGWTDINGDGVREKEGKDLTLVYLAFAVPMHQRIAEVVTPMLESVGFKVDLKILEPGDLYERTLAGKHDLLATSYCASSGIALDDLVAAVHSDGKGSILQWCLYNSVEMDQLLDTARFSLDPVERQEALIAAQKLAAEETLVSPTGLAMEIFGYKKEAVGGVDKYIEHPWAFSQADAFRGLELYKKE